MFPNTVFSPRCDHPRDKEEGNLFTPVRPSTPVHPCIPPSTSDARPVGGVVEYSREPFVTWRFTLLCGTRGAGGWVGRARPPAAQNSFLRQFHTRNFHFYGGGVSVSGRDLVT